jgi:asparagine synthase (glutamine-hydrolysing)
MRNVLPREVLERPKKGFPVPTAAWFRGPLSGHARDVLLDPRSACRSYFDSHAIDRLLREHTLGVGRWEQEIWTLLVFEHWHRAFMSRQRPVRRKAPAAAALGR